jgi:hypothetical protein
MKTTVEKKVPHRLDQYNDWRLWQIIIPYIYIKGKSIKENPFYTFGKKGAVKLHSWGSVNMALEKAINGITRKSEILNSENKELLVVKVKVLCFIAGVQRMDQNRSDDPDLARLMKRKLLERYN